MKILKFSGIGVGIHLLALILIFANPGCSSSTKQPPAKSETITSAEPPPTITVPTVSGSTPSANAPMTFNTDVRYSPTRPGTPAASTLEPEPVNNFTPATTYTVVSGDNLTVIAKKNHLTIAELAAANNLNVNTAKLHPGQKLIVPSKSTAPAKSGEAARMAASSAVIDPATKVPTEVLKHIVKPGENLGSIAQKYGVKLSDIATANNISDPKKLPAGMELVIPSWQAAGSTSARTQKAGSDVNARPAAPTRSSPASTPVIDSSFSRPTTPVNEVPVIQIEEAPATK
ncbi:MAG: LysM peptidoglycan-binding domain-containing protein [Opitutaceae bacterium]